MKQTARTHVAGAMLALLAATPLAADEAPLNIYIDADRTGCRQAGLAIERGVKTALSEVDFMLGGRRVEVLLRDHRGNSRRSRMHLEEFVADENALAVISGLHSPPLLANLDFINENRILVLDPWAAAGPITRWNKGENCPTTSRRLSTSHRRRASFTPTI